MIKTAHGLRFMIGMCLTVSDTELIAKDKEVNKTFHGPHHDRVYNLVVYTHRYKI